MFAGTLLVTEFWQVSASWFSQDLIETAWILNWNVKNHIISFWWNSLRLCTMLDQHLSTWIYHIWSQIKEIKENVSMISLLQGGQPRQRQRKEERPRGWRRSIWTQETGEETSRQGSSLSRGGTGCAKNDKSHALKSNISYPTSSEVTASISYYTKCLSEKVNTSSKIQLKWFFIRSKKSNKSSASFQSNSPCITCLP